MNPSLRKALGSAALLTYLAVYIVVAVTLAERLSAAPWWAQLAFFALAGVGWALPLRPLFKWMNS
jgi:protein-S-isoprenylcysteine O-methyltransferase Ste14